MTKLSVLLFAALFSSVGFAAPKVEVVGVRIVWEDRKDAFEFGGVLNANDPVTVALLVSSEGKGVLEVSEDDSKVTLKDGAGNDLKGEIWNFPKRSIDGKLLMLEVNGKEKPTGPIAGLSLKGELVVLTGEKTETHKSAAMKWEKGMVKELPETAALKVEEAGKPEWGEDPWQVTFEMPSTPAAIKAVRFLDSKGEEIESDRTGSSSSGMFGKMTHTATWSLKKKVAEVILEVEVYTDLEKVEVPLDLKVGG